MRLPTIQGVIRRRILANFRIDPAIIQAQIPPRFRPKLQNGFAVAGICLIRLEHIRPQRMPEIIGINSENAAHRVAVVWEEKNETHEGVFISRRDTNSQINHLLGGRIFPGEHHAAKFTVKESKNEIKLSMKSKDGEVAVDVEGVLGDSMPSGSIFASLGEASKFFEGGALGFSVTHNPARLDGLELRTKEWRVEPLSIVNVYSSYFADKRKFPTGSIEFDHALIMRNVCHQWHTADDLYL